MTTPSFIRCLLDSRWLTFIGRLVFTFMFWSSGLTKLFNFGEGMGEMAHFGLEPAWLFNILTVIVQLGGSLLIIFNCWAWLGAGALAVFTVLTIPLAHAYWKVSGPEAFNEMMTVFEHITVVGALVLASILGHLQKKAGKIA